MTIKDIARISGCSVSTISRVINDRDVYKRQAHRYIEKRAMDTRRSRAEIAQEILDSYEDSDYNLVLYVLFRMRCV